MAAWYNRAAMHKTDIQRTMLLAAFAATTTGAEPLQGLDWRLPEKGAHIEGSTLIVDVPPDGNRGMACAWAKIDVSRAFREFGVANLSVRYRANGVTEPDARWNGVKVMISYVDADGDTQYKGIDSPAPKGTFDWRRDTLQISALANPRGIRDSRVTFYLGLQGCSGHAEFDLSSVDLSFEASGLERVNEDWIVRYPSLPDSAQGTGDEIRVTSGEGGDGESPVTRPPSPVTASQRKPLRGVMLPERPTTEDDIATLASWGATLARFQIMRNWMADNDAQDLDEYFAWIDTRLDNLVDVLRWAEAHGLKIVVDLHSPPGGKRHRPREMNMMHDDNFADAFVETWRRISRRCASVVQTAGTLYGYDLINEPAQYGAAKHSYWELQRRAAEAIREIDAGTPIIFASNMADSPGAFLYLSPLAMDNVIYQIHVYAPGKYTHQGVGGPLILKPDGTPQQWPDTERGWDIDYLRRILEPVREFQKKHQCRIYVGEFSAIAWAKGADLYLRDCISLFEEYGWDWTYHAFREWPGWSVEHEGPDAAHMVPSADNPRKRALLEGFKR